MKDRLRRVNEAMRRLRKSVTAANAAASKALAAVALTLFVASPATAAEIALKLSDDEQKALVELLDLAVKAGGIGAARNVGFFYDKITALQAEATKPPAVDEAPPAADK